MTFDDHTLWKCLDAKGRSPYARYEWGAGEWVRAEGDLVLCENGIHACRGSQILGWLNVQLWTFEYEPGTEILEDRDKLCGRAGRLIERVETWDDRSARLFAADCSERALLRERAAGREPDPRSWTAVTAARAFARGEIDNAAWNAARAAAGAAAGDAAWAAAWAAAGDAAWDAAWAAAGWAAERRWQYARLLTYLRGEDPPPVTMEDA